MGNKYFQSPNLNPINSDGTLFYGFILTKNPKSSNIVLGSAVPLPASALSGRILLIIFNNSTDIIYIGGSDVSTSNGYPIYPHSSLSLTVEDTAVVYGVSAGATSDVRLLEGAL